MSETCCPPQAPKVNVEVNYTPKGAYGTYNGLKTYITGPKDATKGIFDVYDIFGYYPQTIQGADILAAQLNALVVVPDFFEGEPCDHDNYPPDTEEKKALFGKFWTTKADFGKAQATIKKTIAALKEAHPGVARWAIIGLCWGGKIASLASGENTDFVTSVQIHPAMVDSADASALTIPHFLYASGDEPADAVAKFQETLESHPNPAVKEKSLVQTRADMFHGWMGARAKLGEEKYKKAYQEGYEEVAKFLRKNL